MIFSAFFRTTENSEVLLSFATATNSTKQDIQNAFLQAVASYETNNNVTIIINDDGRERVEMLKQ